MSEELRSVVPNLEEIEARMAYHRDAIKELGFYRTAARKARKAGVQALPLKIEPPTEKETS